MNSVDPTARAFEAAVTELTPVVILSTADYNRVIWTNKQHIASRLSLTRPVVYVESLGLRAPRFSSDDLKRIFQKIGLKRLPAEARHSHERPVQPGNLKIVTPTTIPWHGNRLARTINRRVVRKIRRDELPKDFILWTFSPITYGLENEAIKTVYHCVDLLHNIPNVPAQEMLLRERELLGRVDSVVVSSKEIAAHLRRQGASNVRLWENVADISLFESRRLPERERQVVFAGNLTPTKLDFSLIESIANRDVKVVLAGPQNIDGSGGKGELRRLLDHENISYAGTLSQTELAELFGRSSVGIIPYLLNEYTRGVFPMKVYEYLAAGLSVVSTPLPSLQDVTVEGLTTKTGDKFVDEVVNLVDNPRGDASADLRANSWDSRVEAVSALIAP